MSTCRFDVTTPRRECAKEKNRGKSRRSSGQSLSSPTRIHILMKRWYLSDLGLCLCVCAGGLGMFVNTWSVHYAFVFFGDGLMERWEGNYPYLACQLARPLSDWWFVVAEKKGSWKMNVDLNVPSEKDLNEPPALGEDLKHTRCHFTDTVLDEI